MPNDGTINRAFGARWARNLQKTLAPSASHVTANRCGRRCGQLAADLRITRRFVHNAVKVHNHPDPRRPPVHNSLTRRHTCHAGPTSVYPQRPQPLILLLVYLQSFYFEEATWGHIDPLGAEPICDASCQPHRLAFKLSRKDLRWFSDSRYGRQCASGRRVMRHRETAD
jgi:hypothetical protein